MILIIQVSTSSLDLLYLWLIFFTSSMVIFDFFFTVYMNIYVVYSFEIKICISVNGKFMNSHWFIVYKECFSYWIDVIWCMQGMVWNCWENFGLRWGALFVVFALLQFCIIKMGMNSKKKLKMTCFYITTTGLMALKF